MLGTQEEYRPGSLESYMNLRQQEYFQISHNNQALHNQQVQQFLFQANY